MFIYQGINRTAVCVWLAARLQQHPDFFMGHIERPAAPDKHKPFEMCAIVMAVVISLVPQCGLQKPLSLIITYRLYRTSRLAGQFTNFHITPLLSLTL